MQFTNKFNIDIFLKIGIHINLYNQEFVLNNDYSKTLDMFVEDMHNKGFKPYDDALVRSRHKKGQNYSLILLKQLLDFNELKIVTKSRDDFRYNYSDKAVADEFLIERNVLLYLKNKYMVSYQILCDSYSYRASNLSTKFIEKKELETGNESQKVLFPFLAAIYANGSSFLGFSSLAQTLNDAGFKGYKTYNSISRAFSTNSAKVRYINEIVAAYNIDFNITDKKNKISFENEKGFSNEAFKEIYNKKVDDIKGLKIKSLGLNSSDISNILEEAVSFRVQK